MTSCTRRADTMARGTSTMMLVRMANAMRICAAYVIAPMTAPICISPAMI